jgi:reductive dehalogenase
MPNHLSRREFLKDMGLLGVGVGAGVAAPLGAVEAFGEDWNDKITLIDRPWWVKEVDQPTTEINWEGMQRFNERNTARRGFPKYVGDDEVKRLSDMQAANVKKFVAENKPGYSLRDMALYNADSMVPGTTFLPPAEGILTPEDRGVSRWEGTPEENSTMIRAAMRSFGAATVGFVELYPETTEKLIYSIDPDGKELVFTDDEQPSETETSRFIPRKARWVIVWTVQMSQETLTRAPTPLGAMTTAMAYDRNNFITHRLQSFLKGIGYIGLGEQGINALGIAPAFGAMAGLGEVGRINRLITPEYGPMVRVFKMVTDLPLAPTKPIDAGILNFCKACKTCAEYCPSGALSFDTEPSWDVKGDWNNPGHKAWFENSIACRSYWYEVGTNCGICFSVCPFSQKDKAFIHQMVQATVATTPLFNGFFTDMSRLSYLSKPAGEPQKDTEEWWNLDLPEMGFETSRGHKDV